MVQVTHSWKMVAASPLLSLLCSSLSDLSRDALYFSSGSPLQSHQPYLELGDLPGKFAESQLDLA